MGPFGRLSNSWTTECSTITSGIYLYEISWRFCLYVEPTSQPATGMILTRNEQALYIWPTLYTLIMAFIKPAILLEWAKLFVPKGVRNRFWWTCMILVGFNCCVYIATFVAIQMYCTPHERIWKRWVPGTCVNRKSVDFPSSVFNLLQDILILLLPQGVIWRLQMSRSRKISVSIVFAIGILYVVCSD